MAVHHGLKCNMGKGTLAKRRRVRIRLTAPPVLQDKPLSGMRRHSRKRSNDRNEGGEPTQGGADANGSFPRQRAPSGRRSTVLILVDRALVAVGKRMAGFDGRFHDLERQQSRRKRLIAGLLRLITPTMSASHAISPGAAVPDTTTLRT